MKKELTVNYRIQEMNFQYSGCLDYYTRHKKMEKGAKSGGKDD